MLSKIMSLARLYSALRDVTALPDDSLIDAINDYYCNQLPNEVQLPEFQGTTTIETDPGQGQYALDSRILDLSCPRIMVNGQSISHLEQTEEDDEFASEDRPQLWRWQGDQLYLYPTPDDAYLIKFDAYLKPAPLENLNDEPVRGDLQELIALGAARLILNRLGDVERAQKTETQYQKLVGDAARGAFTRRAHFAVKRSF